LGEETEDCEGALEFLAKVVKAPDTDDMLRGRRTSNDWNKVRSLLLRPYFSRIWVVQEVAVARQVILHLGVKSIDWKAFEAAVSIFEKRLQLYPVEDRAETRKAIQFVQVVHRCFHRNEFGQILDRRLSLERLVFDLSSMNACDERDKIFALLGIAADVDIHKPEIVPDYSMSRDDVYEDFYRFCMRKTNSLDVLLRPWGARHPRPKWLYQSDAGDDARPLMHAPDEAQLHMYPRMDSITSIDFLSDDSLMVHGVLLGEVETVGSASRSFDEPIPADWLSQFDRRELIESLLLSYPLGRHDISASDVAVFVNECMRFPSSAMFAASSAGSEQHDSIFEYIRSLAHSRRLIRTRNKSILCLVPVATSRGDCKCRAEHVLLHSELMPPRRMSCT
jgi:hypothetical protein